MSPPSQVASRWSALDSGTPARSDGRKGSGHTLPQVAAQRAWRWSIRSCTMLPPARSSLPARGRWHHAGPPARVVRCQSLHNGRACRCELSWSSCCRPVSGAAAASEGGVRPESPALGEGRLTNRSVGNLPLAERVTRLPPGRSQHRVRRSVSGNRLRAHVTSIGRRMPLSWDRARGPR